MPPNDDFKYDVFISYSSADREWAKNVEELLGNRRVFFDQSSLRAGDDWAEKIRNALQRSRNLILLWSDTAKASNWVSQEIYGFTMLAPREGGHGRRLVVVNLQGTNDFLKDYQQVNLPDLQAAYPDSSKVDKSVWQELKRRIDDGLDPSREPLQVPVIVLTLTREQLDGFGDQTWSEIESSFGLQREAIRQRYQSRRGDWKPLGGSRTIDQILEDIRKSTDDALPGRRLEWRHPPGNFWTEIEVARAFLENHFETAKLSLLVLDPVAFRAQNVYRRLMMLQRRMASSSTAIIALPPFGPSPELVRFRKALDEGGTPFFDDYFRPSVPPKSTLAAQFCWNGADVDEIRRYFLHAAGVVSKSRKANGASPYLSHGSQ